MQWRARQLSAGYSGNVILDNVNLDLEQGAFHVILGLNGAGKSTLLRTLAGLQPGISGQVIAGERTLASISLKEQAALRSIVLSGRQDVVGGLLVEEVLRMAMSVNNNTEESKQRIIGLLHIENFLNRRLHALSDGEFQRVMIARALLQDTPFVFMDEPTAHLDVVARIELMQLLQHLPEELGVGLIITTHEVELVAQAAGHFIIIDADRNVHAGDADWLKREHMISRTFGGDKVRYDEAQGRFYTS